MMSEYDQTYDPNILIGHCDLISRFSAFALYLRTQLIFFSYFFQIVSENDQTFDPNILTGIGHCDQRNDCYEQLSLKAQPVLSIMYKNL